MWRKLLLMTMLYSPSDGGAGGGGGSAPGAGAGAGAGGAAGGAGAAAGSGQGAAASGGSGSGGAPAPVFADTLPEDIRGEATFRDIKDLAGLARSYHHAQKLIGRDPNTVLALPAPDDEAAWNGVFDRLGRPAAADKYQLGEVKLPEGLARDERLQTQFLSTAHKAGLSNKQADALYQWYQAEVITAHNFAEQQRQQSIERGLQTLKTEFGAAFEERMGLAKQALQHYADSELVKHLEESQLGNHPGMVRLFAKLGQALQEDGLIGRGQGAGSGAISPTEAQQEIKSLYGGSDPTWLKAYRDKASPGHKEAVARMERLYQMAYPASS